MAVVVDANLLVVLALDRTRAGAVEELLRAWRAAGETLHAPSLLRYEVASALTRAVDAGQLAAPDVELAWLAMTAAPIRLHELEAVPAVVELAGRLGRRSAYDAAYVVLAQTLGAELWTLDGPLARNAAGLGLPVRLVETA
ncbi:MAG: type II toxin-antitoxin system VapC family toxin [Solirubrobacteraceae bacterium]